MEKRHPDIEINLPLKIIETSDNTFNIIILEAYHGLSLVLRKKLYFNKTLDIKTELEIIDIEIDRTNLILKLKHIMDLTNKFGSEFTISDKYIQIKDEFENLKVLYNKLIGRKEKLLQIQQNNVQQKSSIISSLTQKDINYSKTLINTGYNINQLDEISLSDCYQYFSTLLKLNNYKGFSKELDINKLIEFKRNSSDARYMGYIKDIDEINNTVTLLPLFENELITINMVDIVSNGAKLGINEELILEGNNLYSISNDQVNSSSLLNKPILSKIIIEKYFDGNNYIVRDIKYLEVPEVIVNEPKVQTIEIINNGRYHISNETLFNENGSKFVIGKRSISNSPGKGLGEILVKEDELSGKYDYLKTKSNWRRKLDESYIRNLITTQGEIIIPILIDGKKFASVIHYYHYSKYINSGYSGRKLLQYNRFAERYCLDQNGNLSKLSGSILSRESRKLPIPFSKDWRLLKKTVIRKAILAKFAQNADIALILSATGDSGLLYSTNKQVTELRYEYELMEVRKILENNEDADFYPNYVEEAEQANNMVSEMMTEIVQKNNLDKKAQLEREEFEAAVFKGNLNPSDDAKSNRDASIDVLKANKMYKPGMSIQEINQALLNISMEKQDTHIADLMSQLESQLNEKGLYIKEVPANGDCMYYAIIEGLKHNNVMPEQFVSRLKFIDTRWGAETNFQPVDVGATQNLREYIGDKVSINFENNLAHPGINAIISSIDNVETYLNNVRRMANKNESKDGRTGGWGSYTELNAAAALLKLDFDIIDETGKTISIKYINSSQVFSHGLKLGLDRDVVKINLGYVSGKHYVFASGQSVVGRQDTEYEKIEVYVIDVPIDDTTYKFATYISNDIQLLGIYNNSTGRIQSSIDDDDLQEQLGDAVYEYWEDESISRDPNENSDIRVIEYWQDKSNNKLYTEQNGQDEVGEITIELDDDGEKYIELNFV